MSVYELRCSDWWELVHNSLCFISGAEGETGWSFIKRQEQRQKDFIPPKEKPVVKKSKPGTANTNTTQYNIHPETYAMLQYYIVAS